MGIKDLRLRDLSNEEIEDFIADQNGEILAMKGQIDAYESGMYLPKYESWCAKTMVAIKYKRAEIEAANNILLARKKKQERAERAAQTVAIAAARAAVKTNKKEAAKSRNAELMKAGMLAKNERIKIMEARNKDRNEHFIKILKEFVPKDVFLAAAAELERRIQEGLVP